MNNIYITKIILLLALVLPSSHVALAKSRSKVHSLGLYSVATKKNEVSENTMMGRQPMLRIPDKKGDLLFVFKDSPPHSIKTIRKVMRRLGGYSKSLSHKRFGKSAVFYFRNKEAAYIYSTRGGMLVAMGPKKKISFKSLVGKRVRLSP